MTIWRLFTTSLIIISIFLPKIALAQMNFRHYTTEDGMPSNCLRDIEQDQRGFVWFASDGGITRFDGISFMTYPLGTDNLEGRDDNFAMAIHQSNDELWVGTDSHLYLYDYSRDTFILADIDSDYQRDGKLNVRQITSDQDGNLWVVANGIGALRISHKQNEYFVTEYQFPQTGKFVGQLLVDSRNDIWAVSTQLEGGLYRLDKKANSFKKIPLFLDNEELAIHSIAIAEDAKGQMWIGDWNGQLISFDPFTCLPTTHNLQLENPLVHIHSLLPMDSDKLLIGSDSGLAIYDSNTNTTILNTHDELRPESLSDQFVYPLMHDREGGLWVGTFYGGVNYMMPPLKNFEKYKFSRFSNSVSGHVISAFAEDDKGNIYVASDDGGLSRFSPIENKFQHIQIGTKSHDNLHALLIDGQKLWIGTYSDGVYSLDLATGEKHHYAGESGQNSSYAMNRDNHGQIWLGMGQYFTKYDPAQDKLVTVRDLGAQIGCIKESPDHHIYVATQGKGLYCFEPESGAWQSFRYDGSDGCLPHNHVNSIDFDEEGIMYVATFGPFAVFDPEKRKFEIEPLLKSCGSTQGVVCDQNSVWITSQIGLVRYQPGASGIEVYTSHEGLCTSQFMPDALFKSSNGKIYIGSQEGFNSFMPYQIRLNQVIAPVMFTGLEIDNEDVDSSDDRMPIEFMQNGHLRLEPSVKNFAVTFSALSYVIPEKNQYAYKLEGLDQDWIKCGARKRVAYAGLPAGKYRLLVKGSNNDNIWNENISTLDIEILPEWYATWPMKLLYLILFFGAIFGIYYWFAHRNEEKHHEELRRLKSDKEIEVYQAKLDFFTMVAHEIRTPVSLIIGPLEKMMQSSQDLPQKATKELTTIERNSQQLLFLVNQLLDFKKVEGSNLDITFRHVRIVPLLHSIIERFTPTLEHKGIQLTSQFEVPEDFIVDVDAEAITKLVSNLLNNARKYTRNEISIQLKRTGEKFEITVADNGCGISPENQKKVFRPFYQVHDDDNPNPGGTGLGLSIVQRVAQGHGGEVRIDSEMGKSTKFIVTLPISQKDVDETPEANSQEEVPHPVPNTKEEDGKTTMLVVDDNEELCTFIANSFTDSHIVITASNGEDALKILKQKSIDLVISDWMMPKMDGVELCKAIRSDKELSHIPYVLLTAKTDNMSKIEGLNCGADAYVEKPFSLQVLQARIENLLHMREMLRQKYSQLPLEPIESVAPHSIDNQFLTTLTEIIEKNFANTELDVDFLASEMDMSRSSLYAKIRSLVDVTPNDLIRITRLKNAAKLLVDGRYRINEVGFMVGFSSSSYFSKCFLKQFGLTPTEFVSQSQKKQ